MHVVRIVASVAVLASIAAAQQLVSFPTEDDGLIYADLYGKGKRGVVLAHGGRFNRGSWSKQAEALAAGGFRAVAIDLRGEASHTAGTANPERMIAASTCWLPSIT